MRTHELFNRSGFSRFINSPSGRLFRVGAGAGFLWVGLLVHPHPLGLGLVAWSALPLSSGVLDLCYISAALGGPLTGVRIRRGQQSALTVSSAAREP